MQLMKTLKEFISGSNKVFEYYKDAVIVSVEEYHTYTGKHMMKAMVDGYIYTGTFNQEVFNIMMSRIGVPGPFVLWNINGKGSRMISVIASQWIRATNSFYPKF